MNKRFPGNCKQQENSPSNVSSTVRSMKKAFTREKTQYIIMFLSLNFLKNTIDLNLHILNKYMCVYNKPLSYLCNYIYYLLIIMQIF